MKINRSLVVGFLLLFFALFVLALDISNSTNVTVPSSNVTSNGSETKATTLSTTTTTEPTKAPDVDPAKINAVEAEKGSSLSIFFVLCVIALGILMIHAMLQTHFQYLPESIVTVCLGALIGLILRLTQVKTVFDDSEVFSPTAFFLVLLPPIIFEVSHSNHNQKMK
jgi:solute carrier family 9 (sodium/hydrogen exchanger), member 8